MAQELSLKIKIDLDTQAAIQKLGVMMRTLQESFSKLGANPKILDTGALDKEFAKINSTLDMSAQKSSQAKGQLETLSTQLRATAESGSLLGKAFQFNQISQATMMLSQSLNQFTQPFINFEAALADLSAITGISGTALDDFGVRARNLANTFGGTATSQIESFKGILSRLGPDIAKSPEALEKMAIAVNTLSQASGLDATTSMDALTNSMLQFGVDLSNPITAADEMTKMMNVMAAGAQQGAAEVPQVSEAIVAAGVAASGAKLSFEETNAAIQVLATGGKYGAEAGTALRNSLALLQKQSGPGEAQLKAMGLTVQELGETLTTEGLQPALVKLGAGFNTIGSDAEKNAALFQLFGSENASAMGILLKNTDMMSDLTTKMTGTNTAFEQATINAGSMKSALDTIKANIEDKFITVFQALGTEVTTAIGTLTQLSPVLMTFASVKSIIPDGAFSNIKNIPSLFNSALPALTNFSGKLTGMIPGLASIGTAGTSAFTSLGIAGTASGTATTTAWISALAPIGAVIGAVALVGAGFIYLYDNVESFRKFVDEAIQIGAYGFERLWEVIKSVGEVIMSVGGVVLQYLFMPFQIGIDIISNFINMFGGVEGETQKASSAIKILSATFDFLDKMLLSLKAGLDGFRESISSITNSISGVITKALSGDIIGATKELMDAGPKAGKAFSDGFSKSVTTAGIENNAKKMAEDFENAAQVKVKISTIEKSENLLKDYEKIINEISQLEATPKSSMSKEDLEKLDQLKKKSQDVANEIAKIAPASKENVKAIVDENGNVKEVFDININKAKEFATAQKSIYSDDLKNSTQEYSASLLDSSSLYDQQKLKLEEMAKKAVELKKAGKNDEYKKQVADMQDFGNKVDESKKKLIDNFVQGVKGGTLTKEAQEKVGKQLGLNADDILKGAKNQKELTGNVNETTEAVTKLGEGFSKAMNDAKQSQTDAIGALAELKMKLKSGEIDQKQYNEDRKKYLKDGRDATKEYNSLVEMEKQAKKDIGILDKEKSKKQETEYQRSKSIFEQNRKSLQQEQEKFEINSEMLRIEQERDKNTYDEISESKKKVENLEKEKQKFLELYKVKTDDNNIITKVGLTLGKDEDSDKIKQELNNEYMSIQNNIQKEINKTASLKMKIKIDDEKLKEELEKKDIEQIKYNIKLGIQTETDLESALDTQLIDLQKKLDDKSKQYTAKVNLKGEGTVDLALQAEITSLEKDLDELKRLEGTKRKEIEEVKESIRQKSLKQLEKDLETEGKQQEEFLNQQLAFSKMFASALDKGFTSNEDKSYNNKKDSLAKDLEDGIVTQDEHDKLLEQLEEDHTKKLANIQDMARGAEMEAERQHTIDLLEEKRKRQELYIASLDPVKDKDLYDAAQEKLKEIETALATAEDVVRSYSSVLQSAVSDVFAGLFTGDEEIKESARKMFATIAGILKKTAAVTVAQKVVEQIGLTPGGVSALFLAPVFAGIAEGLMGAIIDPIINSLTSFSTGGRVDEPTVAIVGDASQSRPGHDTEWILRDDQLQFILAGVVEDFKNELAKVVLPSIKDVNSMIQTNTINNRNAYSNINNSINQLSSIRSEAKTTNINNDISNLEETIINIVNDNKNSNSVLRSNLEETFKSFTNNNFSSFLNQISESIKKIHDFKYLVNYPEKEVKLNYNIQLLNSYINRLTQSVSQINDKQLTAKDIITLSEVYVKRIEIEQDYKVGKINEDDYFNKYAQIELKVKSFATGGTVTSPTLAIVGDAGTNNPERVLNDPQLRDIIAETSNISSRAISVKLDKVIDALQSIDFDVYIDSRIATDEVNRENNRRKVRFNS